MDEHQRQLVDYAYPMLLDYVQQYPGCTPEVAAQALNANLRFDEVEPDIATFRQTLWKAMVRKDIRLQPDKTLVYIGGRDD